MNDEQVQTTRGVVGGMILVRNTPATLFDYGASHCSISITFVSRNSVDFVILPIGWDIKTESSSIMTNKVCRL